MKALTLKEISRERASRLDSIVLDLIRNGELELAESLNACTLPVKYAEIILPIAYTRMSRSLDHMTLLHAYKSVIKSAKSVRNRVNHINSFIEALLFVEAGQDTPDSEHRYNMAMSNDATYRLAITIDSTATPEESCMLNESVKEELLTFYNGLSATIQKRVRKYFNASKSIDGTYKPTGRDAQNFFNRLQNAYTHGACMSTPDFIYLIFNYCL